ncbi:MAG: GFA family protein [Spongiibacteraceae bacterium]|nr:GFA family protein [Spongiibacteraceae bacterium]
MPVISGSCLCGHVRYSGDISKPIVAQCHCKNCQRHSGGAYSVNVVVDMRCLTIDKDKLASYQDSAASGNTIYRYSCKNCHSILISGNQGLTGVGYLKAGSLDNTQDIKPVVSVWEKSAQPWVCIDEKLAHFDGEFSP